MINIIKSACIAFSMFSKLPVPQFEWKEEDMRYMLLFFPFVGIAIGAAVCLWGAACEIFSIHKICFTLVGTAIPVLISGGIHIDGYMDTMDALHSYQSRERKLEILKDPHIGAFSAIYLAVYYMLYIGACSELNGWRAMLLFGTGFWFSRILSALGTVYFPCAKKDGLAHLFSGQSDKKRVAFFLYVQLFVCGALILAVSPAVGGIMLLSGGLILWYYREKCEKEFGGVTGDTSGCFTTFCEGAVVMVIAAGCILGWI